MAWHATGAGQDRRRAILPRAKPARDSWCRMAAEAEEPGRRRDRAPGDPEVSTRQPRQSVTGIPAR